MPSVFEGLLVLAVLLQLTDAASTFIFMRKNLATEGNPVMAKLFDTVGLTAGLLLKLFAAAIALHWLWQYYNDNPTTAIAVAVVVDVVFLYIVVHNIRIIRKA